MGATFIQFLEPTAAIAGYDRARGPQQPASVPGTFVDAMRVREEVFVREQGVAAENELDDDDPRCCHWVAYAAGGAAAPPEPIGTLRLVPFPHPPHPAPGGVYFDGKLTGRKDADGNDVETGVGEEGGEDGRDRPTSLHDGREPYVKLGRLAVAREFRGKGIGGLLVATALRWMREHPDYFGPSVAGPDGGPPRPAAAAAWGGLVCAHAQERVKHVWQRFGFEVDADMGRWWEEGMPHVGMFQRLEVEPLDP